MENKLNKERVTKATVDKVAEPGNKEEQKVEQRIYIGPNMLQLITYTVIEGDYPEHIKDLVEKCPEVGTLFVPIEKLAYTETRTKTKGTLEYRNYIKIIEFIQGKGE